MTINVAIDNTNTDATGSTGDLVTYAKNANTAAPLLLNGDQYFLQDPIDTVFGTKLKLEFWTTGPGQDPFTKDAFDNITGGTITSIRILTFPGDLVISTISGVSIDAVTLYNAMVANDVATLDALFFQQDDFKFIGDDGKDTFTGGSLGDELNGKGGADTFSGREGNDVISGGTGNDMLDGGTGTDTVDYSFYLTDNLSIKLGALNTKTGDVAQATATVKNGATTVETDKVKNFENVVGGDGNDTITGNAGANFLDGDDGDDLLLGGIGADTIKGWTGTDTASYAGSKAGVFVDLNVANQAATFDFGDGKGAVANGDAAGDILTGIENFTGSAKNDVVVANFDVNLLNGGAGTDTVSYANSVGGVVIDLSKQFTVAANGTFGGASAVAGIGGDAQGDKLAGFENIIGGDGDDEITGTTGANVIEGGAGADKLTGNSGVDTVSYAGSALGVVVNLENEFQDGIKQQNGPQGDVVGDIISGFTNFIGSAQSDIVQGNSTRGESIFGGGGADDLSGGGGNFKDTLDGGEGDDNLYGGVGGDTLIGGNGSDWAAYGNGDGFTVFTVGVTITLGKGGVGGSASGGEAKGDTFTSVENIAATDFDDILTGNELANELWGLDGNDKLTGNAGIDTLVGGDDNDTLIGGADADILDGGNGNDTISYALSAAGVTVNLTAQGDYETPGDPNSDRDLLTGSVMTGGDAQGDTLWSIENIIGSAKNDVLTALNGTQFLDGGAGDDVIVAGNGSEALLGGAGIDTLSFANDIGGIVADLTQQGKANTTRSDVTAVNGHREVAEGYGGAEFENLIGGSGSDGLVGDAKANVIEGGASADNLEGGGGSDTLSYAGSVNGVNVLLLSGSKAIIFNNGSDADDDNATGFINLLGSAANDTLQGDIGNNVINGGAGKDSIQGHAGADTLFGGAGEDTFDGGLGADKIDGGTSGSDRDEVSYISVTDNITLTLGANGAAAKVSSKAGNDAAGDTLTNIERVYAGDGNDALTGNNLDHDLRGDDGNDTLVGGTGSSFLYGEAGDDIIFASVSNGGKGGDVGTETYSGGDDNDTLNFSKLTSGVSIDLSGDSAHYIPGTDDVFIFDFESIIGTKYDDNLRGNVGAATKVDGGAGNDIIEGGSTADTLIGGIGADTLSYAHSVNGVVIVLKGALEADVSGSVAAGNHAIGDIATGFENLIGSGFDDVLTGDIGNNVIDGGDGSNNINGGTGGFDTASYATRPDGAIVAFLETLKVDHDIGKQDSLANIDALIGTIYGDLFIASNSAGAFTLDGGASLDEVRYNAETVGITVTLGKNGASATVAAGAGSNAVGDKLISIERIVGTSGNDKLTGNDLLHQFDGGNGNDTLTGGTGSSTLNGEGGNDTIVASTGSVEIYDGGADIDTLSFANFAANTTVDVNLATNTHLVTGIDNLAISNFEILIGGKGNDTLQGNGASATTIQGGAGNDFIGGGAQQDTFTGGAGSDTFYFDGINPGTDLITDFANGDKLGIETVNFGGNLNSFPTTALTDASYLRVGTAGVVADAVGHGQFVYDTTNDILSWDQDGEGGNAAVAFAEFTNNYTVKLADFFLYTM